MGSAREMREVAVSAQAGSTSLGEDATTFLSVLYGTFVVVLTTVFKISQYISPAINILEIPDYYLITLYVISTLWLVSFKISTTNCCNSDNVNDSIKSAHASNRWLKGVIALFGFTIVVKDGLELVALTEIENPNCTHKVLYIFMPILHMMYIIGQVAFLFLYAKIHIQVCTNLSRFGIMHVMATNLSVWVGVIADTTHAALTYEEQHADNSSATLEPAGEMHNNLTTAVEDDLAKNPEPLYLYDPGSAGLFDGNCTCTTEFCTVMVKAEKFLFPFLVEFCLISTCLLYVTWGKVGKMASGHHITIKPNYKFYKSYKGVIFGAFVFMITVTVIVLLGTLDPPGTQDQESYYTDYQYLHMYEAFLIACNVVITLGCSLGFYLYHTSKGPKVGRSSVNLDVVLLFICFNGPMLVGIFSILSLSIGTASSKVSDWEISLIYPITDIASCLVQILFIVYGKQYLPNVTSPTPPTNSFHRDSCNQVNIGPKSNQIAANDDRCDECTTPIQEEIHSSWKDNEVLSITETSFSNRSFEPELSGFELCEVQASSIEDVQQFSCENLPVKQFEMPEIDKRFLDKRIIALRDLIMFLVLSNVSMWIFLSLDGAVFAVYTFQYNFYGHSAWTTLTTITTPLSIFLRMHAAACLFEMWSYA